MKRVERFGGVVIDGWNPMLRRVTRDFLHYSSPILYGDNFFPKTCFTLDYCFGEYQKWTRIKDYKKYYTYGESSKDIWFGIFLDAIGLDFQVTYCFLDSHNVIDGKNIRVTVGDYSFLWIDGDKHLMNIVHPLLATKILEHAKLELSDDVEEWADDVLENAYRENNSLLRYVEKVQTLKTKQTRINHFQDVWCYSLSPNDWWYDDVISWGN